MNDEDQARDIESFLRHGQRDPLEVAKELAEATFGCECRAYWSEDGEDLVIEKVP